MRAYKHPIVRARTMATRAAPPRPGNIVVVQKPGPGAPRSVFPYANIGDAASFPPVHATRGAYASLTQEAVDVVARETTRAVQHTLSEGAAKHAEHSIAYVHFSLAYSPQYAVVSNVAHATAMRAYATAAAAQQSNLVMYYPRSDGNLDNYAAQLAGPALTRAQRFTVATSLAMQTCNAVAFLHNRGCVHGDIKPANILYYHHDGASLAADAVAEGAAAAAGSVTVPVVMLADNDGIGVQTYANKPPHNAPVLIGTPNYSGPEWPQFLEYSPATNKIAGKRADTLKQSPSADLWALGCVVYYIYTHESFAAAIRKQCGATVGSIHRWMAANATWSAVPAHRARIQKISGEGTVGRLFASAVHPSVQDATIRSLVRRRLTEVYKAQGGVSDDAIDSAAGIICGLLAVNHRARASAHSAKTRFARIVLRNRVGPGAWECYSKYVQHTRWSMLADPVFNPIAMLRGPRAYLFAEAVLKIRALAYNKRDGGAHVTFGTLINTRRAGRPDPFSAHMPGAPQAGPGTRSKTTRVVVAAVVLRMFAYMASVVATTGTYTDDDIMSAALVAVALEASMLIGTDVMTDILCVAGADANVIGGTWGAHLTSVLAFSMHETVAYNAVTATTAYILTLAPEYIGDATRDDGVPGVDASVMLDYAPHVELYSDTLVDVIAEHALRVPPYSIIALHALAGGTPGFQFQTDATNAVEVVRHALRSVASLREEGEGEYV